MKCLFVLIFFSAFKAEAFPEFVRHGYTNCIACHVSPSGGGVLTEYGRSLSKEIMSTWSREGEENVLWGAVHPPEWLNVGGDVRYIQTYLNNPTVRQGDFFPMQADLDVAGIYKKWTADVTAGAQEGPTNTKQLGQFLSRRHYLNYRPTDDTSIRAGRFFYQYGINQPNHTTVIAQGLGKDEGTESYNLETAFLGDTMDAYATIVFGRPDDYRVDAEKGLALSSSRTFLEKLKVGASLFIGENNSATRKLGGLYGILGFTKNFFILTQADYQIRDAKAIGIHETHGMATYNRIDYEFYQGIHLYFVHQLSYLDFEGISSRNDSYGLGTQLFPRPHFELAAEFYKQRTMSQFDTYYDVGWILLHYYL